MAQPTITEVGRNCWRRSQADRVSVIVDAEAYYRTIKAALPLARHSILLLGWEFDSRTRLERFPGAVEPNTIASLLDHVVRKVPTLRAHVLIWDPSVIYALNREFFTRFKMERLTHPRLRFHFDDSHPLGASHHQKILVIDDSLAFVGGLDISDGRWDSREHAPNDPRRNDPMLPSYPPFHDMMMMVSGPVAADLGELARERWRLATGQKLAPPPPHKAPWPPGIEPGLHNVPVAIARTIPAWEGERAVHEVEALYLDMIEATRRFLYVECQYFASRRIGQSLAARLNDDPPPEMLVISSSDPTGMLERTAMGASRARLFHKLSNLDRRRLLRLYFPVNGADNDVKVHSKLTIVDDEILRVGSANLNNRSFGLDTECDLLIEAAGDPEVTAFIRALRLDLLAEHLGVTPAVIAAAEAESGLLAAVDGMRGGRRSLQPLEAMADESWNRIMPAGDLFDPEKPVESIILEAQIVDGHDRQAIRRHARMAAGLLVAVTAFAVLWEWAPFGGLLNTAAIGEGVEAVRDNPAAFLIAVAVLLLGSLIGLPASPLIAVHGAVFGVLWGFVYSLLGVVLSAAILYHLGRRLGRDRVRRFAGRRVTKVSRSMVRSGIMVIVTLRLVPVATFPVVSLVAGSARIRPLDYLVGTLAGMLPVVAGFSLFGDRLAALLRNPDLVNTLVLAIVTLGLVATGQTVARRLARAAPTALAGKEGGRPTRRR